MNDTKKKKNLMLFFSTALHALRIFGCVCDIQSMLWVKKGEEINLTYVKTDLHKGPLITKARNHL